MGRVMPSGWSEARVSPSVILMKEEFLRDFGIDVVFRGAYGFMPISIPRQAHFIMA